MAKENKDQKTEEASTKRITDAEEKGNFALSKELTSSFILLAAVLSLYAVGQQGSLKIMALWRTLLSQAHVFQMTSDELFKLLVLVLKNTFFILSPILFTIMFAGVLSNLIQTRGLIERRQA